MKKFVKVISWFLIFVAVCIALIGPLISPETVSDDLGNATTQIIVTVFVPMLVGLLGLAMTDDGKGGGSGPPFMW